MPSRTREESAVVREWILAALKKGMNSPRKVQDWIAQNTNIESPSVPTIAAVMKEEGWEPLGYIWEKAKK